MLPLNDRKLLNHLVQYNNAKQKIAEHTFKKCSGHIWYLSELFSAFELLNSHVPVEKIFAAINRNCTVDSSHRTTVDKNNILILNK